MTSSVLQKELANLHEKSEQVRRERDALTVRLRSVDAELEQVAADQQRYDAMRDVCRALDRLKELKADGLFWEGAADAQRAAALVEQAKGRLARFEEKLQGVLERQASLRKQINACVDELSLLEDEVREAYDREARRGDEYVIEREISPIPERPVVMPWSREAETEQRMRKALLVAMLFALVFGTLIPLLPVPAPVRPPVVVVPERLVSMLRKEPPRPEPPKEEKQAEQEPESKAAPEEKNKPTVQETQAARKKAERSGVLAYKESLKELVDDAPAAKLGAAARLSGPSAAGSRSRSLVALPPSAAGSSGGIGNAGISRTIESDGGKRISAVGFTRVESKVADMAGEARPVTAGSGQARTDEEIQIVFDKYKAALYRMYNTELRKDPTLRGRIILRITIEPGGEVSACAVQSSDVRSSALVAMIVERVKKFNFGPKEKSSKTTILYPIDFLPPS